MDKNKYLRLFSETAHLNPPIIEQSLPELVITEPAILESTTLEATIHEISIPSPVDAIQMAHHQEERAFSSFKMCETVILILLLLGMANWMMGIISVTLLSPGDHHKFAMLTVFLVEAKENDGMSEEDFRWEIRYLLLLAIINLPLRFFEIVAVGTEDVTLIRVATGFEIAMVLFQLLLRFVVKMHLIGMGPGVWVAIFLAYGHAVEKRAEKTRSNSDV